MNEYYVASNTKSPWPLGSGEAFSDANAAIECINKNPEKYDSFIHVKTMALIVIRNAK